MIEKEKQHRDDDKEDETDNLLKALCGEKKNAFIPQKEILNKYSLMVIFCLDHFVFNCSGRLTRSVDRSPYNRKFVGSIPVINHAPYEKIRLGKFICVVSHWELMASVALHFSTTIK